MKDENSNIQDWRCHACNKLLAKKQSNHLHIQIGNKFSYVVDGKITAICPRCSALNSQQTAKIIPENME